MIEKNSPSLTIGYARVSTGEQVLSLQLDSLEFAKCDRIFKETVSTSSAHRPQLVECLASLRPGDTLVVWRLDRLARSVKELVEIVHKLAAQQVLFVSLTETIDTGTASGNLTFHLFAALAEFERNVTRERTVAGLAAARARGRLGGRKSTLTPKKIEQMKILYDARSSTVIDICAQFGIARGTFYTKVLGRNYTTKAEA